VNARGPADETHQQILSLVKKKLKLAANKREGSTSDPPE